MSSSYSHNNLPKLDRRTTQILLPIFMRPGVLSFSSILETRDAILESERIRLATNEITYQQERRILAEKREYRDDDYLFKDYGCHLLCFPIKLPPDVNIKPHLYKLAYKIAQLILCEGYRQKTYKGLVIHKGFIAERLGYDKSRDKQIYAEINAVMYTLLLCQYRYFTHNITSTTVEEAIGGRIPAGIGSFLTRLTNDGQKFVVDVNEVFAGSVQFLLTSKKLSRKDRSRLLGRGYYDYPTHFSPLARHYSTYTYLFSEFLISERGNRHLREDGYKVVAFRVRRLIEKASIRFADKSKCFKAFIKTLREMEIIHKTAPTIDELEAIRPSERLDTVLRIWITDPADKLDTEIKAMVDRKSNVLVRDLGEKVMVQCVKYAEK